MARCLTSVSSECPYISIFLPLPSPLPPIHHPPIPTSFVSQRSWSNSRQSHFPPKKKYILLCDKRSCVPFLMACINIFLPIHSFISLLLYYSFNYVYIYIKREKKILFRRLLNHWCTFQLSTYRSYILHAPILVKRTWLLTTSSSQIRKLLTSPFVSRLFRLRSPIQEAIPKPKRRNTLFSSITSKWKTNHHSVSFLKTAINWRYSYWIPKC